MNLLGVYKIGQPVYIVANVDGVPTIQKDVVKKVNTKRVVLRGGIPKSWREDKRISMWIEDGGLHEQAAPYWILPDEATARNRLLQELAELQLRMHQEFRDRIKKVWPVEIPGKSTSQIIETTRKQQCP